MKVTLQGIDAVMAEIDEKRKKLAVEAKKEVSAKIVKKLKEETPVDTGAARDGWRIDEKGDIVNDVPHIAELNDGSSQQAPAHFIESAVMSFKEVEPNGFIVSHTK